MTSRPTPATGRRKALWTRLLAAYAVVVLCSFAVLTIPLYYSLQRDYISRAAQSFDRAIALETETLTTAAERNDRIALDLACDRLNTRFQGRVSIIDPQGRVLGDSMSARCLQRARPECLAAILSQPRRPLRDTMPLDDTVTLRLPLRLGQAGMATVRLALPIDPVRRQMAHMGRMLGVAAACALVLITVLSLWLARRIARPVEDMTRVAERIAAGDFECRTPAGGPAEIGRLAEAIHTMQASLRQTLCELRTERNQAQAIVAGMSDGVVALSAAGQVIYANQAAARLLALPDLRPGTPFAAPAALAPVLESAMATRQPASLEWGDVRRGDRVIHVAINPLDAEGENRGGAVLVLCDRTEARRAETMGRELVANASHELRTPLAIMSSTIDTLMAWSDDLPEQHREFLQITARQAERMQRLVNESLQLSQLESGTPAEAMERLSLAELARQVVHDLGPLAEARQVVLQPLQAEPDTAVMGLEQPLVSALTNLIDNALRYTPAGGTVTVSVSRSGASIVAAVTDTGPGISPAEQARLFDRFVRGQAAAAARAAGSGLGLAISRRIAEIHGGRIAVESALGQGSTFRLILPAAPPA